MSEQQIESDQQQQPMQVEQQEQQAQEAAVTAEQAQAPADADVDEPSGATNEDEASEQPEDAAEQKSDNKKSDSGSRKRKREPTKSLGEFYEWSDVNAFLQHFALPDAGIVDQARAELEADASSRDVTLDDVLDLSANVVNQRQVDKLLAIEKKYADAVAAALKSAKRLIATAQVHKVQREAQALKDQLDAERKAAKKSKTK